MNDLNVWNDGLILVWVAGGLALVFIFFILYDSYRIKRRFQKYGRIGRPPSNVPGMGTLGVARNQASTARDEMKTQSDRRMTLLELQRRYDESRQILAQRQREIDALAARLSRNNQQNPPA